jgi:cardiolipin synthase (CMP-forming)
VPIFAAPAAACCGLPITAEAMRAAFTTTPNRLTLLRLLALPFLWVLALTGRTLPLGIAVAVVSATDVLDGYLARRWRQTSRLGSRLDTIADSGLLLSILLWLVLLRPAFVREQALPLLVWGALGLTALAVGWLRFRRVWDLHLYSSKAGAFLGYVFTVWILIFGDYPRWLFGIAIAASILGAVESLIVYATRSRVDERIGSVFLPRRRPRGPAG